MIGDYTLVAAATPLAVLGLELWWRTGLLRSPRYWVTVAITLGCQVAVDGWLTKLSAPIVTYDRSSVSGLRWPWDIPVEDFGFGFTLITATLLIWVRATGGVATGASRVLDESDLARRREARR